ncbi:MAG: hypothetical protein AB3N10_21720 [Allomuricauda sp.]
MQAQHNPLVANDTLAQQNWVDAQYNAMTLEERIGQLFMVMATSNQNREASDKIKQLITEHHIGGVGFLRGGAVRQAKITNGF